VFVSLLPWQLPYLQTLEVQAFFELMDLLFLQMQVHLSFQQAQL